MKTLTITASFRLRNRLKERIKKLIGQIERADVIKDAGTEENKAVFDGRTFDETLEMTVRLMESLRSLNMAVEKANVVNKEDLIALETLKAEIVLYDCVTRKCRWAEKFRYEENPEGGHNKINQELILDQAAIVSTFDSLKKMKNEIEERLAERNFKTPVDFDAGEVNKLL
jgi:hypothetical protein